MKKIILIIFIIFLSGCSIEKNKDTIENILEDTNTEDIDEKETYVDDNPIKLGLFLYDNNYYNKEVIEDTYFTSFISGADLGSFEVFLTDAKVINGNNFKNTWDRYYNSYTEDLSSYKIGFNIKFILSDGTNFNGNFLEPNIYRFGEYFYVYLYDDIHQDDGVIYSHLEKMEEDTLITSIKLYAVDGIDRVENIILTAFSYNDEDDFDADGNYRGNSRYTIRLKRK